MHYRFYKIAIQDCLAIIRRLEQHPLSLTTRLWIRGIISDISYRIDEAHDLDNTIKTDFANLLDEIECCIETADSEWMIRRINQLKSLLEQKVPVKIRVDMLFARPVSAVYLLLVYHQLRKNDFMDVRIIAADFHEIDIYTTNGQYDNLIKYLESNEVNYISYKDYNLFESLPDMFFYSYHGQCCIQPLSLQHSTISPIINRTMYLESTLTPLDLMSYSSEYCITPYTWLQFRTSEFSYNSISWGKQDIVTGHPLMDLSLNMYTGKSPVAVPEKWSQLAKEKYIVLWNINPKMNSDHSFNLVGTRSKIIHTIKLINEICDRFESLHIIFRPHPSCLKPELQEHFCNIHENVILDLNPDSYPALYTADAYIGDYGSLYMQFLPSEKPALIFQVPYYECNFVFWTQINMTSKKEDINLFIENLLNNHLTSRPITEIDKYCLGPMDGKSSERISNTIINKFCTEEAPFIDNYCPYLASGIIQRSLNYE